MNIINAAIIRTFPRVVKHAITGVVKQTGLFNFMSEIDCHSLSAAHHKSFSLCPQGFPGDFGERGPPGPDGEPVCRTLSAVHLNTARSHRQARTALPH